MFRNNMFIIILAVLIFIPVKGFSMSGKVKETKEYQEVRKYLDARIPYKIILSPEGRFISVFKRQVEGWITKELDKETVAEIGRKLKPHLYISLNDQGFAPAATRATSGQKDDTNYDAIWVRDNVWVYFSFLKDPNRKGDAKKLLMALWDYYATDAQIQRFENIISNPSLKTDQMAMPHIRFNGSSPTLDDVMVDGKPQIWNHRQIDAHGLFFIALGEAFLNGSVQPEELTENRFKVLSLYPLFLKKIQFYDYEDAGAWEELPRKNTSSIGLATRSLQVWKQLLYQENNASVIVFRKKFFTLLNKANANIQATWSKKNLQALENKGLHTVKYQLTLGGESPDYPPEDVHFRLADSALIFLIQPSPLDGLTEDEMRRILLIVDRLQRQFGILRYLNDSYQSGNYWIEPPSTDKDNPALTGDTSSKAAFLWRLKQLIPDTEAQWFFDSLHVLVRLHLAKITKDKCLRQQDLYFATIHLKRALGQITGENQITADGIKVESWNAPESINTIVINNDKRYLPSPIVPLNWAKAGLSMALFEYEKAAE